MANQLLTPHEARLRFQSYLDTNADLPEDTAHTMALFALAPKVSPMTLMEMIGRSPGQTYWRDRAFFWWNAFQLSGMSLEWDWWVAERNAGVEQSGSLYKLRDKVGKKRWATFSRRLGKSRPLLPKKYWGKQAERSYWTKGGTWWNGSPFTTLIIRHHHLPDRKLFRPFMQKLGHENIRRVESELMWRFDVDSQLAPEIKTAACDYVRERIPELLGTAWQGRHDGRMSPHHLPWFFMCNIPYKWRYYRVRGGRPGNLKKGFDVRRWEW